MDGRRREGSDSTGAGTRQQWQEYHVKDATDRAGGAGSGGRAGEQRTYYRTTTGELPEYVKYASHR